MSFESTSTWKNSFEPRDDDEHEAAREHLRTAYMRFRQRVEPVANDIAISMPGYTDHSLQHCDSLWQVSDVVAGSDYPLTPIEAFVLGGSFLVHDLGMGLSAADEGGFPAIVQSRDFRDLLYTMFPNNAEDLQKQAAEDAERNCTWDGISSRAIKDVLTIYLRLNHAAQGERVLTRQWTMSNGESFYLLEDTQLRNWFGEWIGRVARSHWQDVDELANQFSMVQNPPAEFPQDWAFDPLKIAGILRCVDAAQVDERRANPLHTPVRQPQGVSESHWRFQEKLRPAAETSGRLVYNSSLFPAAEAQAWWLAWDTLRMVDNELRKVDALFADYARPRLTAKSVAGVETPERLSKYIRPDGWTPIDAQPQISDTTAVISRLGGRQLYGAHNATTVVIRELIANALDATRMLVMSEAGEQRPIEVELETITEPNKVSVRDYGIGMSASDMVAFLCDFGRSGWRSQVNRERHPGAMSAGYESTGKFGVGFYSVFMIAKQVVVRSRPEDSSAAATMVLEFPHGLQSRPLMRAAKQSERLRQHGTLIELSLQDPYFDDRIVSERDTSLEGVAHQIRALSLLADAPILLRMNGEGPASCGDGGAWTALSGEELFGVIVDETRVDAQPQAVARSRQLFARRARPIHDRSGAKVGMLCLDLGQELINRRGILLIPGLEYAGGFRTGVLHGVSGVLEGQPATAARSASLTDIAPDEIRRWFAEQVSLLGEEDLTESQRIGIARQAMDLRIVLDEFPMIHLGQRLISSAEFRRYVAERNTLKVFESVGNIVTLPDGLPAYWSYEAEDLFRFSDDHVCEMYGGRRAFSPADMLWRLETPEQWPDLEGVVIEGSGREANLWWRLQTFSETAQIIREVARAWDTSVPNLLRRTVVSSSYEPDSEDVENFVGLNGANLAVPAVVINRPEIP